VSRLPGYNITIIKRDAIRVLISFTGENLQKPMNLKMSRSCLRPFRHTVDKTQAIEGATYGCIDEDPLPVPTVVPAYCVTSWDAIVPWTTTPIADPSLGEELNKIPRLFYASFRSAASSFTTASAASTLQHRYATPKCSGSFLAVEFPQT
jgi:hypothetical protein